MTKENGTLFNTSIQLIDSYDAIWNPVLVTIYTVVFFGGICGVIRMLFLLMKMNALSVTTTVTINLVVIHSLFLVTVPFRLYYYIKDEWIFEPVFCKLVSIMIHLHMYLAFLFYMIVLLIRCLIFFQWKDKIEFYRNLHAVATSAAVWFLALVTVVPVMYVWYGQTGEYNHNKCFDFHKELKDDAVKAVNYALIGVMITLTCALVGLQVFMLVKLVKKLSGSVWSHQEFRAQLKSVVFVCVIVFCFLPHHFFRIYYVQHVDDKRYPRLAVYNEVCLSITAISCLDLFFLVISGREIGMPNLMALSCC
ncbi:putative G-protein coupled receptor 141 [Pogona vitticeps]|uniref:Probable G-protein coupled receptor 141 n=1 Tax=Pogona vitticeps TaxID=103695 RepID=A0A6J0TCF0_9SAUR